MAPYGIAVSEPSLDVLIFIAITTYPSTAALDLQTCANLIEIAGKPHEFWLLLHHVGMLVA